MKLVPGADVMSRVKLVGRAAARTAGRWSAGARMTPAFLIVGAQRCGTTSMYKSLSQHQSVLPALLHKGVHYFDTGYGRGWRWYIGHFPLRAHGQWTAARTGSSAITGESSPYYLFHPLAAGRIARDLPLARLIVMVRDPVERAYSAHAHESARGYETETFERALELEESRLLGQESRLESDPGAYSFDHQHHGYLARGRYAEQLSRLADHVGRERIHVVDADEFFVDPAPVLARVSSFLGLPQPTGIQFRRHNARPRAPMDESLRRRLEEHFATSDAELAGWLGAEPSWRR
ncbi:MAG: sulfotransferase family protein [Acidimicrobiales bacterium]